MWRRKRMLEELGEDVREHIERETQDNMERGMTPEKRCIRRCGSSTMWCGMEEETREV